ncbi:DNA-binding phage protein [Catenulispora sp. MAP12-49]
MSPRTRSGPDPTLETLDKLATALGLELTVSLMSSPLADA